MPIAPVTVTLNLADHLGERFDARRTKVWVTTNIPGDRVVDTTDGQIRLGGGQVVLGADGTATVDMLPTDHAGLNPTDYQVYFNFDWVDSGTRERKRDRLGPFSVTEDCNLADLIAEQEVPPTYLSQVTAELQSMIDQGLKGPRGDEGPQGVPGGSDEATAQWVQEGPATKAALSASIEQVVDPAIAVERTTEVARRFGALGDNAVNNAAFGQMLAAARGALRPNPAGGDALGTYVIELPVGDFRITSLGGLLGQEGMNQKGVGLRIVGQGPGLTNVIFAPAAASTLCVNDFWMYVRFEGISFRAATPGSTFMECNTTHNAQDFIFNNCSWNGWRYGFNLKGDNNNSEYRFISCSTTNFEASGAFLFIGATDTSDQFLNYWFYGFKHWSTAAPIVDAAKGGHFHFFGVDVSDFANGETTTDRPLFRLRGSSHSLGVCTFTAHALRVEAKSTRAQLIDSEWPHGSVTFRDTDWSSQVLFVTPGDIIKIKYANNAGPVYKFDNCFLGGGVVVSYGANDYQYRHRITFDGCTWSGPRLTPSEVVSYDESGAAGNTTKPIVEFVRCKTNGAASPYSAGGTPVWDALIGWQGESVSMPPKRTLSVRSIQGAPHVTGSLKVALPVGALVTGVRVMAPAGAMTSTATGASWTVRTTEVTPATVVAATVPGQLQAGFDVTANCPHPFHCSTREKATLEIVSAGANQTARSGMLLIEGYW